MAAAPAVVDDPAFYFKATRPPLLKDFFDPRIRTVLPRRRMERMIEVSFEIKDYNVPPAEHERATPLREPTREARSDEAALFRAEAVAEQQDRWLGVGAAGAEGLAHDLHRRRDGAGGGGDRALRLRRVHPQGAHRRLAGARAGADPDRRAAGGRADPGARPRGLEVAAGAPLAVALGRAAQRGAGGDPGRGGARAPRPARQPRWRSASGTARSSRSRPRRRRRGSR